MTDKRPPTARDEKAANLLTNYSMLFTSMFEDAFADLAAKMSEVTVGIGAAMTDAMVEGFSDGAGGSVAAKKPSEEPSPEIGPQVSAQVKKMFSGIREEVSSKMSEDNPEFRAYLANPAVDRGIAIVEKYDFGRPRLTEKLGDEDLASYLVLLKSGDQELGKMFQELGQWQEGLSQPPGGEPGT